MRRTWRSPASRGGIALPSTCLTVASPSINSEKEKEKSLPYYTGTPLSTATKVLLCSPLRQAALLSKGMSSLVDSNTCSINTILCTNRTFHTTRGYHVGAAAVGEGRDNNNNDNHNNKSRLTLMYEEVSIKALAEETDQPSIIYTNNNNNSEERLFNVFNLDVRRPIRGRRVNLTKTIESIASTYLNEFSSNNNNSNNGNSNSNAFDSDLPPMFGVTESSPDRSVIPLFIAVRSNYGKEKARQKQKEIYEYLLQQQQRQANPSDLCHSFLSNIYVGVLSKVESKKLGYIVRSSNQTHSSATNTIQSAEVNNNNNNNNESLLNQEEQARAERLMHSIMEIDEQYTAHTAADPNHNNHNNKKEEEKEVPPMVHPPTPTPSSVVPSETTTTTAATPTDRPAPPPRREEEDAVIFGEEDFEKESQQILAGASMKGKEEDEDTPPSSSPAAGQGLTPNPFSSVNSNNNNNNNNKNNNNREDPTTDFSVSNTTPREAKETPLSSTVNTKEVEEEGDEDDEARKIKEIIKSLQNEKRSIEEKLQRETLQKKATPSSPSASPGPPPTSGDGITEEEILSLMREEEEEVINRHSKSQGVSEKNKKKKKEINVQDAPLSSSPPTGKKEGPTSPPSLKEESPVRPTVSAPKPEEIKKETNQEEEEEDVKLKALLHEKAMIEERIQQSLSDHNTATEMGNRHQHNNTNNNNDTNDIERDQIEKEKRRIEQETEKLRRQKQKLDELLFLKHQHAQEMRDPPTPRSPQQEERLARIKQLEREVSRLLEKVLHEEINETVKAEGEDAGKESSSSVKPVRTTTKESPSNEETTSRPSVVVPTAAAGDKKVKKIIKKKKSREWKAAESPTATTTTTTSPAAETENTPKRRMIITPTAFSFTPFVEFADDELLDGAEVKQVTTSEEHKQEKASESKVQSTNESSPSPSEPVQTTTSSSLGLQRKKKKSLLRPTTTTTPTESASESNASPTTTNHNKWLPSKPSLTVCRNIPEEKVYYYFNQTTAGLSNVLQKDVHFPLANVLVVDKRRTWRDDAVHPLPNGPPRDTFEEEEEYLFYHTLQHHASEDRPGEQYRHNIVLYDYHDPAYYDPIYGETLLLPESYLTSADASGRVNVVYPRPPSKKKTLVSYSTDPSEENTTEGIKGEEEADDEGNPFSVESRSSTAIQVTELISKLPILLVFLTDFNDGDANAIPNNNNNVEKTYLYLDQKLTEERRAVYVLGRKFSQTLQKTVNQTRKKEELLLEELLFHPTLSDSAKDPQPQRRATTAPPTPTPRKREAEPPHVMKSTATTEDPPRLLKKENQSVRPSVSSPSRHTIAFGLFQPISFSAFSPSSKAVNTATESELQHREAKEKEEEEEGTEEFASPSMNDYDTVEREEETTHSALKDPFLLSTSPHHVPVRIETESGKEVVTPVTLPAAAPPPPQSSPSTAHSMQHMNATRAIALLLGVPPPPSSFTITTANVQHEENNSLPSRDRETALDASALKRWRMCRSKYFHRDNRPNFEINQPALFPSSRFTEDTPFIRLINLSKKETEPIIKESLPWSGADSAVLEKETVNTKPEVLDNKSRKRLRKILKEHNFLLYPNDKRTGRKARVTMDMTNQRVKKPTRGKRKKRKLTLSEELEMEDDAISDASSSKEKKTTTMITTIPTSKGNKRKNNATKQDAIEEFNKLYAKEFKEYNKTVTATADHHNDVEDGGKRKGGKRRGEQASTKTIGSRRRRTPSSKGRMEVVQEYAPPLTKDNTNNNKDNKEAVHEHDSDVVGKEDGEESTFKEDLLNQFGPEKTEEEIEKENALKEKKRKREMKRKLSSSSSSPLRRNPSTRSKTIKPKKKKRVQRTTKAAVSRSSLVALKPSRNTNIVRRKKKKQNKTNPNKTVNPPPIIQTAKSIIQQIATLKPNDERKKRRRRNTSTPKKEAKRTKTTTKKKKKPTKRVTVRRNKTKVARTAVVRKQTPKPSVSTTTTLPNTNAATATATKKKEKGKPKRIDPP